MTVIAYRSAVPSAQPAPVPAPRRAPASPVRSGSSSARAPAAAHRGSRARPSAPPVSRSALALLRQAAEGLAEAHRDPSPLVRYPAAYLSALRAAAAVLAVRAAPAGPGSRRRNRNVWQLMAEVAPELGEWAAFFAACSATRAAAEAGISRLVGQREADDLLRQAEEFLELVRSTLIG
ncbi:hypothetical protein SAMN05443637_11397 [Pseudonocardia thermophila]|uniref:SAV-6107-like HEPN domain-containing protein n=1 Tax=Pseudonocardia thermophila TaxID=1848 RepID=A0A1M6VX14_PSETH|nr:SAV_6107 family HEPN domain-containing protein [Pseudonocardia thermophila]SHK85865.1 hypothetical protein SAMN05443637_11397 [Pseudonocardia thermophila]